MSCQIQHAKSESVSEDLKPMIGCVLLACGLFWPLRKTGLYMSNKAQITSFRKTWGLGSWPLRFEPK